ncbi:MAG: hypothetical protein CMM58_11000 [Rhodospirillaceae bacterium]|nr:hypothetical protein [Rhodospirillaceae bacterium]
MESFLECVAVFTAAFLSATIIPALSEVALVTAEIKGTAPTLLLFAAATFGNTAGAILNWLIGRFFGYLPNKKWFPGSPIAIDKAANFFRRYGMWTLLFSWIPFIGDPLTIVAGTLRVPLIIFIALVLVGKAARYAFVLQIFG